MTHFNKPFVTFLTVLLISCGDSEKIPEKSSYEIRQDKQNLLDSLNQNEASKLSSSHDAIAGWDTVTRFTYYIQEMFEKETKPISFIGIINDVIKKDSSYILKIVSSNSQTYKTFNAEISVTTSLFNKLKSHLQLEEAPEGCFIFQVTNITSNSPILKSEIELNGENIENASSYITLDFDETLLKFHGKLIDFYLYERLKNDDE